MALTSKAMASILPETSNTNTRYPTVSCNSLKVGTVFVNVGKGFSERKKNNAYI
jgi:hypothetical protein